MRRLVTIHAKTAVAATLLLTGVIHLAPETRQAKDSRYNDMPSLEAPNSKSPASQPDPRATSPARGSAIAPQRKDVTSSRSVSDEVSAEQQAARVPNQRPGRKAAKKDDGHARQIIISIPDRKLALLQHGELVKVYPVAVGAEDSPSPEGEFTIINHAVEPTYRHEGKEIAPGKDNPLGTRWMGLSVKGYGIHGTNIQSSVGKAASHGCFRMKKKDVEELYSVVEVGDTVTVRSERDERIANLFMPAETQAITLANKPDVEIASSSN